MLIRALRGVLMHTQSLSRAYPPLPCRPSSVFRRRNVKAYASDQGFTLPYQGLSLEDVLARMRAAARGGYPLDEARNSNAMAFGMGQHMGCEVSWTFIWRPDGAFYEEVRSRQLTYKWGYDGGEHSHCWEVDPTGVSKVLECDDHEATLLGALVKSGNWLVPGLAQRMLDISLEAPGPSWRAVERYQMTMPPVASTIAAASVNEGDSQQQQQLGLQLIQQQQQQTAWDVAANQQQWAASSPSSSSSMNSSSSSSMTSSSSSSSVTSSSSSSSMTSSSSAQPGPVVAAAMQQDVLDPDMLALIAGQRRVAEDVDFSAVHVAIKLKGGRMIARLRVSPENWLVWGNSHPLCSDTERWEFRDWTNWTKQGDSYSNTATDLLFPGLVVHVLFPGTAHHYHTHGATVRGSDIHRAYQLPASPPVPIDAQYLDIYSSRVPVWQTSGGHMLAECHINGRRAGWMILDTGASGFVVEPAVADQFELPMFGDLRISGVAGKVKTRFRRASQLRIGPLVVSDPVMMEMRASKLISGFHDRVVGIAGFDVFRRCRMTLPCHKTRMNLIKATSSMGQVKPHVANTDTSSSAASGGLEWPPSAATTKQLQQLQAVQQQLLAATQAAGQGPSAGEAAAAAEQQPPSPRRKGRMAAAVSAAASAAGDAAAGDASGLQSRSAAAAASSSTSSARAGSRRRRSRSASSSLAQSSSSSAVATELLPLPLQQQQVQAAQAFPVTVPPNPPNPPFSNHLIELLLQRPQPIRGPQDLEEGYVWQKIIMIASLPHIELEFVVPHSGKRHVSLFLVDTGAGGSEIMFHSRAARELQLIQKPLYSKYDEQERMVSGVDNGTALMQLPLLAVQAGQLPELVIRGQAGSNPDATGTLVVSNVAALFSKQGGLDISLYSAGMVCVDLLARMQVVLDYPNRRIGWKVPAPAPAETPAEAAVQASSTSGNST